LHHLLTYMFLFHYHRWCLVYCYEWFCQFALVDSVIWPDLLILLCAHTIVHYLILPHFLAYVKCSWLHTPSCLFIYCLFASIGRADVMCSAATSNCGHILYLPSVSVSVVFLLHDILW
jgi:hypothetical protein